MEVGGLRMYVSGVSRRYAGDIRSILCGPCTRGPVILNDMTYLSRLAASQEQRNTARVGSYFNI
jgi:hypothetical protein